MQMLSVFSGVAANIPGFDCGRFDVKLKDLEDHLPDQEDGSQGRHTLYAGQKKPVS
jgi:hypothetical protein